MRISQITPNKLNDSNAFVDKINARLASGEIAYVARRSTNFSVYPNPSKGSVCANVSRDNGEAFPDLATAINEIKRQFRTEVFFNFNVKEFVFDSN